MRRGTIGGSIAGALRVFVLVAASAQIFGLAFGPAFAADMTARDVSILVFHAAPGSHPSLDHRDLTRLDLSGLDFKQADLSQSNLFGADLSGANLSGTDLSGAILDRVTLVGAKLDGARLDNASLMRPSSFSTLALLPPRPRASRALRCAARGFLGPSLARIFRAPTSPIPIVHPRTRRASSSTFGGPTLQARTLRGQSSRAPTWDGCN
jgi:hypothetical protein